jgi:hypothetical protein
MNTENKGEHTAMRGYVPIKNDLVSVSKDGSSSTVATKWPAEKLLAPKRRIAILPVDEIGGGTGRLAN